MQKYGTGLEKHVKKERTNKEFQFSVRLRAKLDSSVYSVPLGVGQNILQIVYLRKHCESCSNVDLHSKFREVL